MFKQTLKSIFLMASDNQTIHQLDYFQPIKILTNLVFRWLLCNKDLNNGSSNSGTIQLPDLVVQYSDVGLKNGRVLLIQIIQIRYCCIKILGLHESKFFYYVAGKQTQGPNTAC